MYGLFVNYTNLLMSQDAHLLDRHSSLLNSLLHRYNAQEYRLVDSGKHNFIAIFDESVVVRIPRHKDDEATQSFENRFLQIVAGKQMPFQTPKVVEFSSDSAYMVCSYLEGDTKQEVSLNSMSESVHQVIGNQVAHIMRWMKDELSVEWYLQELSEFKGRASTCDRYLGATVGSFRSSVYPQLTLLAAQLYSELSRIYPNSVENASDRVIHDDLFIGNLVFNESNKTTGVLDFGYAVPGDAAREMRQMYRLSPTAARACISEYSKLTGEAISYAHVKFWAEIAETSILCQYIQGKLAPDKLYERARDNIVRWYPNTSLRELPSPSHAAL
jgi:aminoglycoside phosphotransferase (APT) family kinase protein